MSLPEPLRPRLVPDEIRKRTNTYGNFHTLAKLLEVPRDTNGSRHTLGGNLVIDVDPYLPAVMPGDKPHTDLKSLFPFTTTQEGIGYPATARVEAYPEGAKEHSGKTFVLIGPAHAIKGFEVLHVEPFEDHARVYLRFIEGPVKGTILPMIMRKA